MDLVPKIVDATTEIFETMLMMTASPGEPLAQRVCPFKCSVSGIIGMAGLYKGMLAIHVPAPVAKSITGNFLGMDVEEINEDVQDAIGELANMLGGSLKMALSENGKDIQLSIPSAICGEEYSMDCAAEAIGVMVPFSVPEGDFLVEVQIQKLG